MKAFRCRPDIDPETNGLDHRLKRQEVERVVTRDHHSPRTTRPDFIIYCSVLFSEIVKLSGFQ